MFPCSQDSKLPPSFVQAFKLLFEFDATYNAHDESDHEHAGVAHIHSNEWACREYLGKVQKGTRNDLLILA